jgi:hypothetical protein
MTTHKHEAAPLHPNTAAELVALKRAKQDALPRGSTASQAEADVAVKTKATVPAVTKPQPVTTPDNRPYTARYLDEVSPASMVGRMLKFNGKDGRFLTPDDGQEVPGARRGHCRLRAKLGRTNILRARQLMAAEGFAQQARQQQQQWSEAAERRVSRAPPPIRKLPGGGAMPPKDLHALARNEDISSYATMRRQQDRRSREE